MAKLNLDKIFKRVFKNSIHYANSIIFYDVVIPDAANPKFDLLNGLYFEGRNINEIFLSKDIATFHYHGHDYRLRRYGFGIYENPNDFGKFYVRITNPVTQNNDLYIPVFFKEVLYETEQGKRDGNRMAPISDAKPKQL